MSRCKWGHTDASLNDILVLAINGQLTTSYTGKLTAIDEALAPASSRMSFKEGREEVAKGGKRNRHGFGNAAKEARGQMKKAGEKDKADADKVKDTTTILDKMTLEALKVVKKRKAPEENENESLNHKLARCGTSEFSPI